MSKSSDSLERSFSERISEISDRVHEHAGDEAMLGEISGAMQAMLAENGESEANIREELQRQFDAGEIRPESFELVQKMVDKIVLSRSGAHESPTATDVQIDQTAKIDMSKIVELQVDDSDSPDTVDLPAVDDEKPAPLTNVDIPLVATQNIEQPEVDAAKAEPMTANAGTDTGHARTMKIDMPFLESAEARESVQTDDQDDSDEEFITTAVLDEQQAARTTRDAQLQVGSVLRDRFLLQEEVSGGSMGVVFKALDRRMAEVGEKDAHVAVKVLSSKLSRNATALRALQQEAAKGRYLSHPNIVRFIDLDRDDELYFIVMEWLEGRSLAEILDESPDSRLDLGMSLNIVSQIARALDYAHQRGVVHADVKPDNIMITPDGHAKLLDFGVARIRQKQVQTDAPVEHGALVAGSPAYSSMQVLTGEDPAPADDVFSLACLMYRLVAGIRVFGPRDAAQAAADGMEPQKPQVLNETQWKALKKALSYSRVTRFAEPRDFMRALGKAATKASGPVAVPQAPAAPVARPPAAESAPVVGTEAKPVQASTTGVSMLPERPPVMRATRVDRETDSPFLADNSDESRRSPFRLVFFGALLIGAIAIVTQTSLVDYVDEFLSSDQVRNLIGGGTSVSNTADPEAVAEEQADASAGIETLPMEEGPAIVETSGEVSDEIVIGESGDASPIDISIGGESAALVADEFLADESNDVSSTSEASEPEIPEFDYSGFVDADVQMSLAAAGEAPVEASLTLREGAGAAVLELVRRGDTSEHANYSIEEAEYDGNFSPLDAGQYAIQDGGVVNFVPGQERAQIAISMATTPDRKPHRNVSLRVVSDEDAGTDLGILAVRIEDAQQLEYEARYSPDTITFATDQVLARESDPAVQIDVSRLRPSRTFLDVAFVLSDGTANEGQDYFAPRYDYVSFGAGQESARVLIPLGQDAVSESSETFVMELRTSSTESGPDIITRVTITILDDD